MGGECSHHSARAAIDDIIELAILSEQKQNRMKEWKRSEYPRYLAAE